MRLRVALALAVVVLAVPRVTLARPAVIRVFEAEARAQPEPDAPVVHRFVERTEVSVSEDSKDGWRSIRLPDGGTGWIEETAIVLGAPLVAPPAPPVAPAHPDLRARLFIEDEGQLPRIMAKDPEFAPKAESLVDRRTLSYVLAGLGLATSMAFTVAGANQMGSTSPGDPNFAKASSDGSNLFLAGMVSLAAGAVAAIAVYPRRSEVLDLVNGWNIAHPDEQLSVRPIVVVPSDTAQVP